MGAHEWELDVDEFVNPRRPADMTVERCSICGCYRITTNDTLEGRIRGTLATVYKPGQFTWNPFKTLKHEPPCPAIW